MIWSVRFNSDAPRVALAADTAAVGTVGDASHGICTEVSGFSGLPALNISNKMQALRTCLLRNVLSFL